MLAASQTAARASLVDSVLEEYGGATRKALYEYLPQQEPREYLYDLVAAYPRSGGQMLRPSLCIATARAFGASVSDALVSAVALEILHNALLIHRDIEDGTLERRGRPAIHVECGTPMAINVGDMLTLISLRPLLRNRRVLGPQLAVRVLAESQKMARESTEGQAIELGWAWEKRIELTEADYLQMLLKKSCWITTIYPCRLGALIATRDGVDLSGFIRFGFFLGAAYEIQNDLVALELEKGAHARTVTARRTLPMIHLLTRATPGDRARLVELLSALDPEPPPEERRWVRERMRAYGSLEYAAEIARGLAGAARHEFALLFHGLAPGRDWRFIEALPTWIFTRSHG